MFAELYAKTRGFVRSMHVEKFEAGFFPYYSLWLAMALLTVLCLAIWSRSTLEFSVGDSWPTLLLGGWLFCIGGRYHNHHHTTSAIYFVLSYLILIAPLLGAASYLATAAGYPLIDAHLAAFDRMIGFDWVAHTAWVNDRPWATSTLTTVYNQLLGAMTATLLFLLVTRRFERIREVMLILGLVSISSMVFVTFAPAIGAYAYYDPAPGLISNMPQLAGRYHLPDFTALRHSIIGPVSLGLTTGLVTFPSFHTITPVMCNWATRGTWAFWLMLPFTVLMVISTLSIGGHPLADIIAALACCALSAWVYARWHARWHGQANAGSRLQPAMLAGE